LFGSGATFDAAVCESRRGVANYLFQNNHLSNGGCYNITWTLAAQMHFYILFPLVLVVLQPHAPGFKSGPYCISIFCCK
jgi:peptidoglycan/LPS O-acetylase OafA/YrhL